MYKRQEETQIEAGDPVTWGVDAWTTRAPSFAVEAGYPGIADGLDPEALSQAGTALRELFGGLEEPNEVSYFELPQSVLDGLAAG